MPLVRILKRHPIVDAVITHLGSCARCRARLASDLSVCGCGHEHVNGRGTLTAFLPHRFAWTFRTYAPRWRNDQAAVCEVFLMGHPRATRLFCALARCVSCGERLIAPR